MAGGDSELILSDGMRSSRMNLSSVLTAQALALLVLLPPGGDGDDDDDADDDEDASDEDDDLN